MEFKFDNEVWRTCEMCIDGSPAVFARWIQRGDTAELHNAHYSNSLSVIKNTLKVFEVVKEDMRNNGIKKILVIDKAENVNNKRIKYWRLMGFLEVREINGHKYSVMEV